MIQMIEGRSKVAKVVVLDVDGTLMDTNYLHVEAWARAFEEVGHRVPRVQIHGHPLPGAKELISSLLERGYEVWFVTSAKDEELEHHMSELEAEGHITGVINSSAVENPKPAPDIFELALQSAGTSPDETVAVGDTVWDVEAADAAGIHTVAVLTGGAYSRQELEEAGAVTVYEDCAAILDSSFPE